MNSEPGNATAPENDGTDGTEDVGGHFLGRNEPAAATADDSRQFSGRFDPAVRARDGQPTANDDDVSGHLRVLDEQPSAADDDDVSGHLRVRDAQPSVLARDAQPSATDDSDDSEDVSGHVFIEPQGDGGGITRAPHER